MQISDSIFEQLKTDCECNALIFTICHDPKMIAGVTAVYTFEDSVILERVGTTGGLPSDDKYRTRYELYPTMTTPDRAVTTRLEDSIQSQKQGDQETPFSWHVEYATDEILDNSTVEDLDGTYVGPERLEPPFDIPDDEPVAILDISHAVHREIEEAQNYKVGLPIEFERFRGKTYLIGITKEGCEKLSKACSELKREHKDMDFFEEVENADRAAGIILDPEIQQPESA